MEKLDVNREYFTKECTLISKGVAIILMLCHHVFTRNANMITIGNLSIWDETITFEYFIGHFGKLCVSILTFLSGYGIYLKTKDIERKKIQNVILRQIYKFYLQFWKYTFFAIIISTIVFKGNIYLFFVNILAIDSTWFGGWWYASPYIMLLFFYPILHEWLNRKRASFSIDIIEIFFLWTFSSFMYPYILQLPLFCSFSANNRFWWIFFQTLQLMPSFLLGSITAKYEIYNKIWRRIGNNFLRYFIAITMCVAVIVFRTAYGDVTEDKMPEFAYSFFWIFGTVTIIKAFPRISNIFINLGRNSTGLWLSHSFLLGFQLFSLPLINIIPHYSFIMLITLGVVSYIVVLIIDSIWSASRNLVNMRAGGGKIEI